MLNEIFHTLTFKNDIHQFILAQLSEERQVIELEGKPAILQKYRFPPLLQRPTLLVLTKLVPSAELTQALKQLSVRNRKIVFLVKSTQERQYVANLLLPQGSIVNHPPYKSWQEKAEMLRGLLQERELVFQNTELRKLTVRLLIKHSSALYSKYRTLLELSTHTSTLKMPDIEYVFGDIDEVNLFKWSIDFLLNRQLKTTLTDLHYFTEQKHYAVPWLHEYIKKTLLKLMVVQEAYVNGVFLYAKYIDNPTERMKVIQFNYADQVKEIPYNELRLLIDAARKVDSLQLFHLQSLVLKETCMSLEQLYQTLAEVRREVVIQ